jgi:hypothetical protein
LQCAADNGLRLRLFGGDDNLERVISRARRGEVISLRVYDPSEGMRTETVINYRPR